MASSLLQELAAFDSIVVTPRASSAAGGVNPSPIAELLAAAQLFGLLTAAAPKLGFGHGEGLCSKHIESTATRLGG